MRRHPPLDVVNQACYGTIDRQPDRASSTSTTVRSRPLPLVLLAVRPVDFIYRRCGRGGEAVVNLSAKGCKVESDAAVRVGEAMSLIILFPDQKCPTTVDLAMVRWAKGHAFGLEFISIGASEALRIRDFLSR